MIPITDLSVRQKIQTWQTELMEFTGIQSISLSVNYPQQFSLTLEEMAEVICHVTKVPMAMLKAKTRLRKIVLCRHLLCYYGRQTCRETYKQIGEFIGGRDHTTAIHGEHSVENLMVTNDPDAIRAMTKINTYLDELRSRMEQAKDLSF